MAFSTPGPKVYYFHSDHLGSSTYLTDLAGQPYQFFINLPFGETMAERRNINEDFETPYKFNGKELDTETGLYYYGARYYDPKLSIWMSVDPLAENYPNMSPYNYCMNNPLRYIDPTGMAAEEGEGIPPGELPGSQNNGRYIKHTNNGTLVKAPNGKYYKFSSDGFEYTYSDGKTHQEQQKKEGVWSVTNKSGNWMWHNTKQKFVLNTSDRGAAENSFPSVGKAGTTYAGGDNPLNKVTGDSDYSQPPQNFSDFAGYLLLGMDGVLSGQSTKANNDLIYLSRQVISMYNQKQIDSFTGAPVSKLTMKAALNIVRAFMIIEQMKR